MAFQLIPLPISILFILVLAVVSLLVLYKLKRKARIYSWLFKASLGAIVVLLVVLVYSLLTSSLL